MSRIFRYRLAGKIGMSLSAVAVGWAADVSNRVHGAASLESYLGFTVIAAVVTVFGNLVALFLKDVLSVRSFERWKAKQALLAVYERYRKPIGMAAKEISGRAYSTGVKWDAWRATAGVDLLKLKDPKGSPTGRVSSRFYRYKLLSDAYRLCCLLGWLELYRRDAGLLDVGAATKSRELNKCIGHIRASIADGQHNWRGWRDALIFREEQRAIGHRMIVPGPGNGLIDFGTFCERLEDKLEGEGRWFLPAVEFFSEIQREGDYRRIRLQKLVIHLTKLRLLLEPGSVLQRHQDGAARLERLHAKDEQERAALKGERLPVEYEP